MPVVPFMHRLSLKAVLALCAILFLCPVSASAHSPGVVAAAVAPLGYQAIPLSRESCPDVGIPGGGYKYYVKVRWGGRSRNWLLDTGCTFTSVDRWYRRDLQPVEEVRPLLRDPAIPKGLDPSFCLIPSMDVGAARIEQEIVHTADLKLAGWTEYGVLGMSTLLPGRAIIDLPGRALYLLPKSAALPPDALSSALKAAGWTAVSLGVDRPSRLYKVHARAGWVDFDMLLDSGAAFSMVDARIAGALHLRPKAVIGELRGFGNRHALLGKVELAPFQVGPLSAAKLPVAVSSLEPWLAWRYSTAPNVTVPFEGVWGTDLFSRHQAIFDVGRAVLYLKPLSAK
jgi:hypothetical protein